jgi:hypothetical protein
MKCPGLVADDLSGFWRGSKPGDRDAARGADGTVCGGLERHRGGRLSCVEAAELLLGISERHFLRLRDRCAAEGAEGLIDRRRGRASGRRAAVDRIEFVVSSIGRGTGIFTVKHFHEALRAEHGFALGYTWTKAVLQSRELVAIAPSVRRTARSGRVGPCPA